jgi:uncharacterized protein YecE (DUF72 family)
MGQTRIGISGWSYDDWRGVFYPADLPRRRQLEYASRRFNSIEINGSFYALQRPESYRSWYEQTPDDFVFAVKGNRFITHNKKLKDVETPLANFLASGVLLLKEKLGPIVWQLPANLRFDAGRLEGFLHLLPADTESAACLARRHDSRVKGRCWTTTDANRRLRHVLEVRHAGFLVPEFVRLLRASGVALAFADSADWPYTEEISAGFVYLRLHGAAQTYASNYSERELTRWTERIRMWRSGKEPSDAERITDREPPRRQRRDVYIYFDNDRHAYAPRNALRLAELLAT